MIKLDKIYTRGGDDGETSLGDGTRVAKISVRIEALGRLETANAMIGVTRNAMQGQEKLRKADQDLSQIQNEIFDAGSLLCRPEPPSDLIEDAEHYFAKAVTRLEKAIDTMNKQLKPLGSFILPGGNEHAAHLHLARTLIRDAERAMLHLDAQKRIQPQALKAWLNRLSDYLFVLARATQEEGDVLWTPALRRRRAKP